VRGKVRHPDMAVGIHGDPGGRGESTAGVARPGELPGSRVVLVDRTVVRTRYPDMTVAVNGDSQRKIQIATSQAIGPRDRVSLRIEFADDIAPRTRDPHVAVPIDG